MKPCVSILSHLLSHPCSFLFKGDSITIRDRKNSKQITLEYGNGYSSLEQKAKRGELNSTKDLFHSLECIWRIAENDSDKDPLVMKIIEENRIQYNKVAIKSFHPPITAWCDSVSKLRERLNPSSSQSNQMPIIQTPTESELMRLAAASKLVKFESDMVEIGRKICKMQPNLSYDVTSDAPFDLNRLEMPTFTAVKSVIRNSLKKSGIPYPR